MNKKVNIYLADDLHPKGIGLLKKAFNLIELKGLTNNILLKKIRSHSFKGSKKNSATLKRFAANYPDGYHFYNT